MKIILASASARRKEILNCMNINFEAIPAVCNEKIENFENIEQNAVEIAKQKAREVCSKQKEDVIVIAADTIVCFEGKILGKPKNDSDAITMLSKIQSKTADIYTGMCVLIQYKGNTKEYIDLSKCQVIFDNMSDMQIKEYVDTQEPLDKAGAFAIQGKGAQYIKEINGDFYAGVGLSMNKLYITLLAIQKDMGIDLKKYIC